tara:strand:+ start:304 stop:576 length:273 start_codon:yes stop_codon:yes gene_type:complete
VPRDVSGDVHTTPDIYFVFLDNEAHGIPMVTKYLAAEVPLPRQFEMHAPVAAHPAKKIIEVAIRLASIRVSKVCKPSSGMAVQKPEGVLC